MSSQKAGPQAEGHSAERSPARARNLPDPQVGEAASSAPLGLADDLLRLQRLVGNGAVQRAMRSVQPNSAYLGAHTIVRRQGRPAAGRSIQRNAKFDEITGPSVEKTGAPDDLAIPKAMKDGMDASWASSFPGGTSQEQGGILVRLADGKYEWRAGPPGAGGSFMPNYGDVRPGETLVATGHTHPYDATEGGHQGVSLSGGDISSMVTDPAPTGIVHSGNALFIVAKTKEFEELVAAANTRPKKKALMKEIDDAWDTEFAKAQKSGQKFVAAVETAAKIVCSRYHLLYYAGSAEKMEQPDRPPKVHVEMDAAKVGAKAQ